MTLNYEILDLSASLDPWQQDALRRVITQEGEIDAAEISELADMALNKEGSSEPIPITIDDLATAHEFTGERVVLTSLHSVKNVNALAEGQSLGFSKDGLTVIYGENGSGKSGYSRILRRVCRARKAPRILPNVYGDKSDAAKASFTIFTKSKSNPHGQEETVDWQEGGERPSQMARFMVFDRTCEQDIIDGEAEAEFTPSGFSVYKELASVLSRVKLEIEDRINKVESVDLSAVKNLVANCAKAKNILDEITDKINKPTARRLESELLSILPNEEEIIQIEKFEKQLQAPDPIAKAKRKKRIAGALTRKLDEIEVSIKLLDASAIEALRADHKKREECRRAADLVEKHSNLSGLESISPGIGGSEWKILYEAAESYAITKLHPDTTFDASVHQDKCPLCLQDLDDDARDRFVRFHAYMDKNTREKADAAEGNFKKRVDGMGELKFEEDSSLSDLLFQNDMNDAVLVMSSIMEKLEKRRDSIVKGADTCSWSDLVDLPEEGMNKLRQVCQDLDREEQELISLSDADKRSKLELKLLELRSRKSLNDSVESVKKAIALSYKRYVFFNESRKIKTRGITDRGKTVAEELLRSGLREALESELKVLGVAGKLSVDVGHRGSSGKNLFRLDMDGVSGHKCSDVWSEGEQRVVAVGYFLAEAQLAQDPIGIIFDDPICSLDHRYSYRIASQLVSHANDRQVIVFTHSLSFMLALERLCGERQTPLTISCVRRSSNGPGTCDEVEGPWDQLPVRKQLPHLEEKARELKNYHPDSDEYRKEAEVLGSRIRNAWERVVEEVLLNESVVRFGLSVQTQRLSGVQVTDDDYKEIHMAMARMSWITEAHSNAADSVVIYPSIDDLLNEIQYLRDFVKKRQADVERLSSQRKKILGPPRSE